MNIEVRVVTNAKKRSMEWDGVRFKVRLTSLPVEGKANDELIEYISDILGVRRSEVKIVRGQRDKRKVISVPLNEDSFHSFCGENARVTKT